MVNFAGGVDLNAMGNAAYERADRVSTPGMPHHRGRKQACDLGVKLGLKWV